MDNLNKRNAQRSLLIEVEMFSCGPVGAKKYYDGPAGRQVTRDGAIVQCCTNKRVAHNFSVIFSFLFHYKKDVVQDGD